jgi:ribosomal protein S18 acetylase RimI-like enzyme
MDAQHTVGMETVREAGVNDCDAVGRLLHDFNIEFSDPTPPPSVLAARLAELISDGDTGVLLIGDPVAGLSVMRFRKSIWSPALECYLAELYIVPALRGHGLGRRLLEASLDFARGRGATYMDLGTADTDVAARALYESVGFDNHEGRPDGPINYYYEREL